MVLGLFLALFSAISQSIGDVIIKKKAETIDADILGFSWFAFGVPFFLVSLLFFGLPEDGIKEQFWTALVVSGTLNVLAVMLYTRALRESSISKTIPMLSFTPVFLLVTSPIILGEFPSVYGILGIILVVCGAYLLNFDTLNPKVLGPLTAILKDKGPALMLVTSALFSVAINFDKIGVQSSSPSFYATAIFSYIAVGVGIVLVTTKRNRLCQLRANIRYLIPLGLAQFAMGLFALTALGMALAPYVIAIKRTSILYSSVLGFAFFKEVNVKQKLFAIAVMVVGVFIIFVFS